MDPLDALAKVCGDVRPGEPEEGVLGVTPRFVAAPGTVAEAAEVMRVAAEQGLAVIPRGGETRLDWGLPPGRCDLLLDTSRLDRVIEHAAGDLVVKAEAGLTMERLAEVLAGRGQRLSLDVPLPGSTVGGTIATGAAGPLRLLYGSPRDLVIGLTIVRADGQIARSGGKVVKNVAGYDLGRLFAGSYGTLGVIVEAAFRLHPVPSAHAYVTTRVPDAANAHEAVQGVLHSPVAPSALECEASGDGITLGVLLEGVPEGVAARATRVADLLGPGADISHEPPAWWGAYPDGTTLIEVTAPPSALAEAPAATEGTAPADGAALLWGAALAGVEGCQVRWSASGKGYVGLTANAAEVAEVLARLRTTLARHRGGAVVRYAPEGVRTADDVWGPVPALTLMRRVKAQFDPEHRLSPGRFVGGI
ncbi:FAD-binding oxidoreductase [Actinomadura rudentiformis]|uniref:FAD-binding oxidoreductase n=1 Tax=Actinomadura rudentiformis TaxID=359158 RepID=A0A6H9YXG3_9ACTN|nr:FAD-binding oxidoreductase [Actinomadura rudentiformis]